MSFRLAATVGSAISGLSRLMAKHPNEQSISPDVRDGDDITYTCRTMP
ncbi:hypothetical protein [Alcanivorax sp.]|nr:hypothetical protein [Alcanivorax sp.]